MNRPSYKKWLEKRVVGEQPLGTVFSQLYILVGNHPRSVSDTFFYLATHYLTIYVVDPIHSL